VNPFQGARSVSAYGTSHWVVVVLLAAGALLLIWLGRKHRETATAGSLARWFAVAIVVFQVLLLGLGMLPSRWDVESSLPLHLCDLAWMVAAYALWSRREWAFALTYYWGLTLTPQALITPSLDNAVFPDPEFLEFWGQHCLVLWAAIYLTWWIGLRPNWRGYWIGVAVTVAWGVFVLVFNDWAGTNYGFVSRKPTNPSLLDLMGGWPWYLGVEVVVGMVAWALLTWPWTRSRESAVDPGRRCAGGQGVA
jgi:hypothetical integral membrane protein (TIGR02206 family)